MPFSFLDHKDFYFIWLLNLTTVCIPDVCTKLDVCVFILQQSHIFININMCSHNEYILISSVKHLLIYTSILIARFRYICKCKYNHKGSL